jgi:hypothetical protein
MIVYIERQPEDKNFAVYLGGDGYQGNYDRLFSYGSQRITVAQAHGFAYEYAERLAREFRCKIAHSK